MTSELRAAARFIAPRQLRPESHMAMVGEAEQTIVNELQEYDIRLFIERKGNVIVAVMGYEHDDALQRGFFTDPGPSDNDGTRSPMSCSIA